MRVNLRAFRFDFTRANAMDRMKEAGFGEAYPQHL
jgi:hypothetical protein